MAVKSDRFNIDTNNSDVLVIGAGGAGARAALGAALAGATVTFVSRSPLGRGGLTPCGNGGYHAAMWPGDSPEIHAEDLISMGSYLNDPDLVYTMTSEAAMRAKELAAFGAKVNFNIPSKPAEPQMRFPRSLFCPGREILRTLNGKIRDMSNVTVLEDHLATRLLTSEGRVVGAVTLSLSDGTIRVCIAKTVVLAAGSFGELYPLNAQEPMGIPTGSTGTGYAMAAWAGAELVDMEEIQFAIAPARGPNRGMRCLPWAKMVNSKGEEFLTPGEGPYSDIVARDIWREITEGRGPVTMDLRGQVRESRKADPITELRTKILDDMEVMPWQKPIEISIGPLYCMGGVKIDKDTRTSLPGLFAAGEVSGNVHGGRRVSGNAFPEMIVFGARAGEAASKEALAMSHAPKADQDQVDGEVEYLTTLVDGSKKWDIDHREIREQVRQIMYKDAHLFRNETDLTAGLQRIDEVKTMLPKLACSSGLVYNLDLVGCIDARAMVTVASAVFTAALARKESRGAHYRTDYPALSTEVNHTVLQSTGDGWDVRLVPVSPHKEVAQ
jgi:fumarate reductase (CoM/CoB) subunit A